jgi:hypothetical protein
MTNNPNAKTPKNAEEFYCSLCNFKCCKLSDWKRHLLTLKHKNLMAPNASLTKKTREFKCECGKIYRHSSSLCNHKKNCKFNKNKLDVDKYVSNSLISNCVITPELIIELIKNNKDMHQTILNLNNTIIEQNNTIQGLMINGINNNSLNTINQTNSNNKSFNLQFFLNETCKNAMNIMDFANSIQLKLTDLENVGELGYVDGISKIIIDNLKLLDITERPVHCSNFKREVLYVKDNDKWEKENENNTNIKKIINCVTNKNISLIPEWKQKYPECTNSNSKKSTQVNKMIMEIMETDSCKNNKIIKKIAKEVIIDKS